MSQISKEAVAGVWPVQMGQAHITGTFPSISSTGIGKLLGRIYGLPFPIGFLLHIVTLPVPIGVAIGMYVTSGFRRYVLTSLHIAIRQGIRGHDVSSVKLVELDDINIVVRAGQEFYRAADLELISRGQVALTLAGVANAETFRHNILTARTALVGVLEAGRAEADAAIASKPVVPAAAAS